MEKLSIKPLTSDERKEILIWTEKHENSIPDIVHKALNQHSILCEALGSSHTKLKQILIELRKALGINGSSEKRKSSKPIGKLGDVHSKKPKNKREQLLLKQKHLKKLSNWHRELAKKQLSKIKDINKALKSFDDIDINVDPNDIELTSEEKKTVAEEERLFQERLQLGDGEVAGLQSVDESILAGSEVLLNEQFQSVPADLTPYPNATVIKTFEEQRERIDFSFSVTKVYLDVEKKVIEDHAGNRTIISGSTEDWGPPGYNVTWELLTTVTELIVQYAMPMNRICGLLSTEDNEFTSGHLSRYLQYVARRFLPIYLQLIDLLSDSENLMGDDTKVRVLEVKNYFANKNKEAILPPWYEYRNTSEAKKTLQAKLSKDKDYKPSLGLLLANELGFEFSKRSVPNESKRSFQTTIISGRSFSEDPQSRIVIYRSHLGGFGNLLEMLLEKRSPTLKELTIQSDLSTVNLVSDDKLRKLFNITYAGCASHARRPFAMYEHEDPVFCEAMLHYMQGLFIYEKSLDVHGRNYLNVSAVRDNDSRRMWRYIKEHAELMKKRWSQSTKLGQGARYIIKNFDKLTAYLDNPKLELTNNFSERMLRAEKLIEDGAHFRKSLEGRFALDIMRSVLQTATIANIPHKEYLMYILKAKPDEIEKHPENYTPYAYREICKADDNDDLNSS